jgi:hypothetical protein
MQNLWAGRDERAVAVEHRAGWVAYQVMGYCLLLDMILHTWKPGITDQTLGLLDTGIPLDIPVIILIGGIAQWAVIIRGRILGPRRAVAMGALLTLCVVIAVVVAAAIQAAGR